MQEAVRCVAVDTGGFGNVWGFRSRGDAYLNVLVQYGDALLTSAEDVLSEYNHSDWPAIYRIATGALPPPELLARIQSSDWRVRRNAMRDTAQTIWGGLLAKAKSPPSDFQQVCELVARARRTDHMAAKKNASGEKTEAKTADATEAKKAPAEPKFRGPKGAGPNDTIHFGAKDGKSYGPDNCPKRPGSNAAKMWALYTDGMTVKSALDAGISSEDIAWNIDKGFITLTKVGGDAAPASDPAPVADEPAAA